MNEYEARIKAAEVFEKYKVKDPKLFDQLVEEIMRTGRVPLVRFYWDSRLERLQLEIIG